MKYDKKLFTQRINELTYEVEMLRTAITTASEHLRKDNEDRSVSFFEEAHKIIDKMLQKNSEFVEHSEWEKNREKLS